MEKIIRKYGVIILFYITIICGVFMLSTRLKTLNNSNALNSNQGIIAVNK